MDSGGKEPRMDVKRNGWLTYAAVMMFIAAGLYAIWAINLWADSAWVADVSNGVLGDQGWLWGVFDAVMAVVFVFAGKSLLDGRSFGRWVAVVAASIGIVRWFYWMAFTPFLALAILAMLFLVLYAVLVTWGEET
jgi:hypothetical protein